MPLLRISTNSPIEDKPALLQKASATVAQLLGKPERYVMIEIQDQLAMMFDGSIEPLAYLELKSIGLPGDRTGELSTSLCQLILAELGIQADRIYIEFADAQRHMWGWNQGTF
jgi:phenylpyruvate tautomerase PptA (4-oxalocrotonate tautomerase family)